MNCHYFYLYQQLIQGIVEDNTTTGGATVMVDIRLAVGNWAQHVSQVVCYAVKICQQASLKQCARYICMFILSSVLVACMDAPPYETRLPADLSKRTAQLERAISQLPDDDRDMLSRYILRKKLSASYNQGAPPRSRTINAALTEQQQYELSHPHDPTGKVAYLKHVNGVTDDSNQRLLVSILRLQELPDDFNHVEMQLVFSNAYDTPIRAFSGTVCVQDVNDDTSFVDIPISESFLTPVVAEDSRKVRHQIAISQPVVMKAIKDLADVRASLISAKVMLTNDRELSW